MGKSQNVGTRSAFMPITLYNLIVRKYEGFVTCVYIIIKL